MSVVPTGVYITPEIPWWLNDVVGNPADILASTITVNSVPNGNILLTHNISSGTEYNAPIIFQRPPADINAPSESLVMNTSLGVPTKPTDGEYITATKAAGTAYDDIAVAGLQIYGDQTTAGNAGAAAYITGQSGNLILAPQDSVYISSLFVSTLTATNVVSTTATTGTSLTLTSFLSSASVTTGSISTNTISTSQIVSKDIFASTLTVSTLNAPNFTPAQVSTIIVDTKVTLTSTLSLTGNPTNIDLGLGDVIQGLIGGAATQALGAGLGGAGLITGAAALVTGRTSGGVNNNIFQTVNGSTQLQFSTIGASVSSVFLTVDSPNPFTTPGLEISTTQGVAAGTYCVRSVGDPLYITNNVSSIQMYGQWVPVIQPTATLPAVAISSLGVSSINGAAYPPPVTGIPSTLNASTINVNGNLIQSGTGTFNWGGNTMSGTQVVLNRPTSVNATLTTSGAAFLNASATVNSGLTVASGLTTLSGGLNTTNITANALSSLTISTASLFVSSVNGVVYPPPGGANIPSTLAASTITVNGNLTQSGTGTFNWAGNTISGTQVVLNSPTSVNNTLTTSGAAFLNASATVNSGLTVASGITSLNGGMNTTNITANALSTFNISTGNINVSSVNGAVYPPPGGGGIPSTLNASTINFNGGLTNTGTAPIITNALSSFTLSTGSLFVSSVNGVIYPPPAGTPTIPSTIALSTVTVNGNLTQSGTGTFNWGGNTMSATQVVLNRPTSVNGTLTTSGTAFLNAGATVNAGLNVSGTASFNNQVNMGQNAAVNGSFSVNNGTNLYGGLNVVSGNLSLNQFGAIVGASVLAASLNIRTPALSTINISTGNINVSSVNGAVYPPGGGGGIPSTLNASTLTVNGGQTITNGGLVVSGGNVTIQNQAQINNDLTVVGQTFALGGLVVQAAGAIFNGPIGATTTIQVAGLATLNGGVITPALSTNTISTAGLLVSSINNTPYPPPVPGIPSTLNASTINVNGGINIANGGIINNSFEPIRTGFLSTNFISTGLIRADTIEAPIFNTNSLSTNVIRAQGVSTIFLSSQTTTASIIGCFQFSSLTASINFITTSTVQALSTISVPRLDVSNLINSPSISTTNIQATSLLSPTVFTTNLQAANSIVSLNSIASPNMNVSSIILSSINNAPYPPLSILPTGAVFMWGGVTVGSVPIGWLICDGSLVSATTYANLFAVIGNAYTKYPNVPVAGSFYLPDLTYAIPQNPPTPTYAVTITVKTFTGNLINYPFPVGTNSIWEISGFPTNTLNVGTVFPAAQIPGALYDIYINEIITLQSSGVGDTSGPPSLVQVFYAPPGSSALPNIPTNITITSQGALNTPGTTYWKPGTYNTASTGNPNPWNSPQINNLYNRLYDGQIPPHQHDFGGANVGPFPPGTGAVEPQSIAPQAPVQNPTSKQLDAFGIDILPAAPPLLYPTMPNIINMYYIIKV
jgi:hypothetical protein